MYWCGGPHSLAPWSYGASNNLLTTAELVASQGDGPIEVRVYQTMGQQLCRVLSKRIAEVTGFRPQFTIQDALADLQRLLTNGDRPNSLSDSEYFNVRRINEILGAMGS
jgi:hypothetical protein